MFKVSILKNGVVSAGAQFESEIQANVWISQCESVKAWGKPAGKYRLSELSEVELAQEISRITENEFGPLMEPLISIPAQYTIQIVDITAELAQQKINAEALSYLASTDWYVIRQADVGTPIPPDVVIKRKEARNKINLEKVIL